MTPNRLLVSAWARFRPAHTFSWHLHVSGRRYSPNTGYGFPCFVYRHTGNLGNECADHAAALGSLGLVSNHNLATRSVRHSFDTSACFGDCNNIDEVLENCVALELKQHRYLRTGVSAVFPIGFYVTLTHAFASLVVLLSAPFPAHPFCSSGEAMENPTSSVSTTSGSGESFAHNMSSPLLELLFHGQISGAFEPFIVEIDLAKIALSCHFALDVLCYKEGAHDSA